jgi:hypothetical protein
MNKSLTVFLRVALVAAMGLASWCATAGGVRIESGSLACLKQEGRINLEFDYSGMKVGAKPGDCVPEEEFVARQVARQDQKNPGRSDAWKQEWIGQRAIRFQPTFQRLLNRYLAADNVPLEFGAFKDAKYTLILKTKVMLTGVSGPFGVPARLSADALFVETENRTNTVAVVKLVDVVGQVAMGACDLGEAYSKAAKELGILIGRGME